MDTKKLAKIGPCVSILVVRLKREDNIRNGGRYCKKSPKLVLCNYWRHGPGIMEAGNKQAKKKVVFNPFKDRAFSNNILTIYRQELFYGFWIIFCKKVMFVKYSQGFIVLPGGFGT